MSKFKPMAHQAESIKFLAKRKRAFDASSPGTGKTLVQITDFAQQHKKDKKAMLVLCPKSLMQAAWGSDIAKFAPHLRVSLCYAQKRTESLNAEADVYVVNVDGAKDLAKMPKKFWKNKGNDFEDSHTFVAMMITVVIVAITATSGSPPSIRATDPAKPPQESTAQRMR